MANSNIEKIFPTNLTHIVKLQNIFINHIVILTLPTKLILLRGSITYKSNKPINVLFITMPH